MLLQNATRVPSALFYKFMWCWLDAGTWIYTQTHAFGCCHFNMQHTYTLIQGLSFLRRSEHLSERKEEKSEVGEKPMRAHALFISPQLSPSALTPPSPSLLTSLHVPSLPSSPPPVFSPHPPLPLWTFSAPFLSSSTPFSSSSASCSTPSWSSPTFSFHIWAPIHHSLWFYLRCVILFLSSWLSFKVTYKNLCKGFSNCTIKLAYCLTCIVIWFDLVWSLGVLLKPQSNETFRSSQENGRL